MSGEEQFFAGLFARILYERVQMAIVDGNDEFEDYWASLWWECAPTDHLIPPTTGGLA